MIIAPLYGRQGCNIQTLMDHGPGATDHGRRKEKKKEKTSEKRETRLANTIPVTFKGEIRSIPYLLRLGTDTSLRNNYIG